MIHHATQFLGALALLGTLCSLGYYGLCLWGAAAFLRKQELRKPRSEFIPPVSILKPLKGSDPEMYENFRSHCLQEYADYEIIFGISDANDPAAALVMRLQNDFPQRAIRLMHCPKILGTNIKISNLAQMLREAKHDYIVVNDSDIRVEPDYLRRVMQPLADHSVGMVTCLYKGVANATLGSELEATGISTDFCGGVLAATQIEGEIRFGLGSTLALRRSALERIGGFEVIVDYLADDYEIGSRIAGEAKVELSDVVVETYLPAYGVRDFIDHQLRWARSVRDSRPWGYVGLALTFGLLWGTLALACLPRVRWTWIVLALAAGMRLAMAYVVGTKVLQDRAVIGRLHLIPLRDVIALLVWLASFAGHKITWRGDSFTLKNGRLVRVAK
jgi:ceramide glucosyltransferase